MLQPSTQTQHVRVIERMKSKNTLCPTSHKPGPSLRPPICWGEKLGILQKTEGDRKCWILTEISLGEAEYPFDLTPLEGAVTGKVILK